MILQNLDKLTTDPSGFFKALKDSSSHFFDEKVYKEYDPANHAILKRPKMWVEYDVPKSDDPEDTDTVKRKEQIDVVRISRNDQYLIVQRAVMFLCGGGVVIKAEDPDATGKSLEEAVKKLWNDAKLDYENGKIAEVIKSQKECAELWYLDKNGKWRMKLHEGKDFALYPVWDEDGDLIAFGIGWTAENQDYSEVIRVWTADNIYRFENTSGQWLEASKDTNTLKKIPIVFHYQHKADYEDVQPSISRLEESQSYLGDRNDKITDPAMKIVGTTVGVFRKGQSNTIQLEHGSNGEKAEADYLNPPGTPDSIELEQTSLKDNIYSGSQTPDFSFNSLKGLGEVPSGELLKQLCIDAYIKAARSQQGEFGKAIQRRINILIAIAIQQNNKLAAAKNTVIKPVFREFSTQSLKEVIELWMKASGNQPLVSGQEAIAQSGIVDDPAAMWNAIQAQQRLTATNLSGTQNPATNANTDPVQTA